MTVSDIIKSVRWCIDEESVNTTNLVGASSLLTDTTLMDNIIMHRIGDALRWVCLYAPLEFFSGTTSSGNNNNNQTPVSLDLIEEITEATVSNHLITFDSSFLRLIRVKAQNWHRAILGDSLLREDSPEYLQLRDTNGAAATIDRPQAALINTKTKAIEVWPTENAGTFTVTYVNSPSVASLSAITVNTDITIPPLAETSFIYYLAYLLLSAYGDSRAKSMFEIATLNMKLVK